jgi:hypothetical protein
MLAHTFRGSTIRTWLGLEDDRRAFERYRAIRRRERDYLPSVPSAPNTAWDSIPSRRAAS